MQDNIRFTVRYSKSLKVRILLYRCESWTLLIQRGNSRPCTSPLTHLHLTFALWVFFSPDHVKTVWFALYLILGTTFIPRQCGGRNKPKIAWNVGLARKGLWGNLPILYSPQSESQVDWNLVWAELSDINLPFPQTSQTRIQSTLRYTATKTEVHRVAFLDARWPDGIACIQIVYRDIYIYMYRYIESRRPIASHSLVILFLWKPHIGLKEL